MRCAVGKAAEVSTALEMEESEADGEKYREKEIIYKHNCRGREREEGDDRQN